MPLDGNLDAGLSASSDSDSDFYEFSPPDLPPGLVKTVIRSLECPKARGVVRAIAKQIND